MHMMVVESLALCVLLMVIWYVRTFTLSPRPTVIGGGSSQATYVDSNVCVYMQFSINAMDQFPFDCEWQTWVIINAHSKWTKLTHSLTHSLTHMAGKLAAVVEAPVPAVVLPLAHHRTTLLSSLVLLLLGMYLFLHYHPTRHNLKFDQGINKTLCYIFIYIYPKFNHISYYLSFLFIRKERR